MIGGFYLSLLLLGFHLVVARLEQRAPQDLPWTPLEVGQPIGLATRAKLQALAGNAAACRAFLERSGARFRSLPDRLHPPGCAYAGAVALRRGIRIGYEPAPVTLSCPMAAGLLVWERQVVDPAARRLLGSEVTAAIHFGGFSCRRMYGRATGPWSEHAGANAIDLAGFRTASGGQVTVLGDWAAANARGAFVRQVQTDGCRLFGTTLGPAYNAAHRDHLHLDLARRAGWRACR